MKLMPQNRGHSAGRAENWMNVLALALAFGLALALAVASLGPRGVEPLGAAEVHASAAAAGTVASEGKARTNIQTRRRESVVCGELAY